MHQYRQNVQRSPEAMAKEQEHMKKLSETIDNDEEQPLMNP